MLQTYLLYEQFKKKLNYCKQIVFLFFCFFFKFHSVYHIGYFLKIEFETTKIVS